MPANFDPQSTVRSPQNAKLLAHAANVAYQDAAACRQWATGAGFASCDFFSQENVFLGVDTQGFIAQDPAVVLVAFRGTQPEKFVDWITDFKAQFETWGPAPGKVHKGFYEALRVVWPDDGNAILPQCLVNRGTRTVWITGHSLGGALAELCAAQAALLSHIPVQGVYTFGQPRVGNKDFATLIQSALGSRIFRYVNDRDIVPRVPLFGMGYRHYASAVLLKPGQGPAQQPSSIENALAALRFALGAIDPRPFDEAKVITDAVISAGFHADLTQTIEKAVLGQENALLGDLKAILKSSTQNITDHSMDQGYLPRVEAEP